MHRNVASAILSVHLTSLDKAEAAEAGRPFTAAFHIGEMLEAYDPLRAHATTPPHIIPGRDPLVMRCYPPGRPEIEGIVIRTDVMPCE